MDLPAATVPRGIYRIGLIFLLALVGADAHQTRSGPPNFEERVAAQRAVEAVYWRHRIWPETNPRAKPDLQEVMPETLIRSKVEDYLKKSAALERLWNYRISGDQLQTEINRMVASSRAPAILNELFAALGHDPLRIAECLARPALVDRLIRERYARDDRFHGELRRDAQLVLGRSTSVDRMAQMGGEYSEVEFHKANAVPGSEDASVALDEKDWDRLVTRLAGAFGLREPPHTLGQTRLYPLATSIQGLTSGLPLRRLSALQEEEDRFYVTAVLEASAQRLRIATVTWFKLRFDAWWDEQKDDIEADLAAPSPDYRIPTVSESTCVDDTWVVLQPEPDNREFHTAVWTGSEMIVWGGRNGSGQLNTGDRYDPATDSWVATRADATAPQARAIHTAVWTGSEMIVWGGNTGTTNVSTGGRYNPATDSWIAVRSDATTPVARNTHTAVWTGSEMIVWGGFGGSGIALNTGGRYDPGTNTWSATKADTTAPSARYGQTAVWTDTEMIVWGGYNSGYLATGGRYNPKNDKWTATALGLTGRNGHAAVWTGSEMIVWGGNTFPGGAPTSTGGRYNPATDGWIGTRVDATTSAARNTHTAVWTGSRMIVWGGFGVSGVGLNTGGRYDPQTDTWISTKADLSAPEVRGRHTAVWTGGEMIVWGGSKPSPLIYLNTGGRYDPASDSWIPTHAKVLPNGRERHTAIWTGSEMIVWGGLFQDRKGDRYDPATDTWTPTNAGPSAPSGRRAHTAVWTGSEMIVWGGTFGTSSPPVLLNTGGRYNPATDSWMATNADATTPSARQGHTAVWTGTEMIVWGGCCISNAAMNTGGRYDPSTDRWTSTNTDSTAPSARENHTAVWTGRDMIIWGGASGPLVNSGGRYDPRNDRWDVTNADATAPTARFGHTAVWTGTEMIVWGGTDTLGSLNSGGRYDPIADGWMATKLDASTPEARAAHTAIWTGREMIVWGGQRSSPVMIFNSGGRYDPQADSWKATNSGGGSPAATRSHTAVWTGREMIVYGGGTGNGTMNRGGRYCACVATRYHRDADGDGYGDPGLFVESCSQPAGFVADGSDCNDADPGFWGVPTEVRDLTFTDATTLAWVPPAGPGAAVVVYDAIRSESAADFVSGATCVASDSSSTLSDDPMTPAHNGAFFYLVRAQTGCPNGQGPLGTDSNGTPRVGRDCP
jgi:N-acetylneuraminic acid mutarotase